MSRSKPKSKKGIEAPTTLSQKILKVLVDYAKAEFVLMTVVGFASWGILELLNIKYAVILGIITGTLSVIPGFGMTIATILAGIVAIFDGEVFLSGTSAFIEGLAVVIIFFFLNKLVDWVLAPMLLGKITKVNPIILLLAVILGTISFGVPGAFLAVPLLLVAKTAIEHLNK